MDDATKAVAEQNSVPLHNSSDNTSDFLSALCPDRWDGWCGDPFAHSNP